MIKLTEYSHGQGCGCKISPKVLDTILASSVEEMHDSNLLVGNHSRDDAAVYDLGNGEAIISTTDFFMPIVDDPTTFGRIAATNAISDVYAMGGVPLMAIAIFGWPLDKLPPEVGQQVIEGGRMVCADAGITLAGGHSIDAPEPIFGLAVTGKVAIKHLKENSTAKVGDKIYLTKPLGIGILTTAQKQKKITPEDEKCAINTMCQLNDIGSKIAKIDGINAITDVTGFGLGGHLSEVCLGSKVSATINYNKVPILPNIQNYLANGCSPGGAQRNFDSYGHHLSAMNDEVQSIICDPQTSGGLLIMVSDSGESEFRQVMQKSGFDLEAIGEIVENDNNKSIIQINV
ncbi:selenide, water dikinase SelD [thiotrophic endosymbiont of Bathymodiolus puteoserpentis (Logatchev)]|uniref:selenide, water dikinase SelD n=1 Tax=thiotrophic endosymbiont of Bathymodiolus puteoserpentis (Logatchev) TaxID=343240 RepID=UPI0010BC0FB5|nr:selenide, water dikinase SelD [thiotrophic endosymbiont of Bathymodiolus puteoserpentis (Logatchev)]CAC9501316.1 Selenide,water dikinase (EC 2.7.9.3) [uncultured Gammaproteobacteria bacterium]CAC9632492.1 Selenide,water dikinase (EC 2.7.9.3) [uncultured Gammaproteobacteria bacterium]CAC9637941.1 Selenide,water dikinase (EC 2.7.9.3) [uncultured Gammaproteobacteria bacterium]CAC9982976.1 Selenide,water dikinase (EC 2.7.9.3) [uncultured Gammaproteobacteria bacterium]SSC11436.1 Selenide,water d